MSPAIVHRISVYALQVPLRSGVTHAVSRRGVSNPVVVSVELRNGTLGYGETSPRTDVTGENVSSVVEAIERVFASALLEFHPTSFPEALEAIDALPWKDTGDQPLPAARAAVELALLDATMRFFRRSIDDVVQWMGLPGFGSPGSIARIRYSGILAAVETEQTLRRLRRMYWEGLRDFKLKVGMAGDRDRLARVAAYLARPLARDRATLRVDADGAWSMEQARDWLVDAEHHPIACVEQPLPKGSEDHLPELRERCKIGLMHDESLVTLEDAKRLIELGVADGFNVRISQCGGLIPSLRIAALARRFGVRIQLGCTVGETSILSAAGLRFVQVCPGVVWAEGCFGGRLLPGDVTKRSLRFGYGGRPPRLKGPGFAVDVDPGRLRLFCEAGPSVINL